MQPINNKDTLVLELINEYEKIHENIYDNSQRLETKSQINASIAGIFIAFVFSATKDLKHAFDKIELLTIYISFGCLIVCIVLSIATLFIRFKKYNPNCQIMDDLLNVLNNENFNEYIGNFYNTLLDNWKNRVNNDRKQSMFKAICVIAAQIFLFSAVISISFLTYHFLSR